MQLRALKELTKQNNRKKNLLHDLKIKYKFALLRFPDNTPAITLKEHHS